MGKDKPHVQAVRPVSKDTLDSPTSTPAPTVYFDCHLNPATGKSFVLWDDIHLVFTDALYVRHEAKVVPFMKDAELIPLKPLRIAAVPNAVLDIVVDSPLVHLGAALQQTTLVDTPLEPPTAKHTAVASTLRRNPVYGLEEMAMDNYSHIDHPGFGPRPRAPQFIPVGEQEEDADKSTVNPNSSKLYNEPMNINPQATNVKPTSHTKKLQSPQDHAEVASSKDISSIVLKATHGDTVSQVELGNMYKVGDGVEQDYTAAHYWYLKAANQDDPSAQSKVGDLYRLGLGVEVNHSRALGYYNKAADKGNADGQFNIGILHEYGLVGAVDFSAAMDWYMKAANQGHAFAQCSIGALHANGQGVPQDHVKARDWYLRAAYQDLPVAHFVLGQMYTEGEGVTKNTEIALVWCRKATSRKDTDAWAQFAMALMYRQGFGVPQDDALAFVWALKSAQQGLLDAQHIVGTLYCDGAGVPQDYSKALFWLLKSANHNHMQSQYVIGTLYCDGAGVPQDYSKALFWLLKSATRNHAPSQYVVGALYLEGRGVPKNYQKAKEWFSKAVNLGYEPARARLSEVEKKATLSRFKFW